MTVELHGRIAPSWIWGTEWQHWACRASQVLGLLVVLALLLAIGWGH
jgi:hypothetical protein